MMAMPTFSLSAMLWKTCVLPSKTMSPVYSPKGWTPLRTFMSVDLPAPFSPTRQWISCGATEKVTSLSAFTPGKVLVMFFISRMGVLMAQDPPVAAL